MKYCPYCGTELLNGAASFCTECGKSLTLPHKETDLPRTEEPPQAETKKRQRGKRRPAKTKNTPNGNRLPYLMHYIQKSVRRISDMTATTTMLSLRI